MINGHGNDIHQYKNKIVADFSTNVFDNPETNEIIEYLKTQVHAVKNYPDCNCTLLREKFSKKYKISPDSVLVCNGSTEAFYLVAHLFKCRTSIILTPSFSEYEDACKLYGHSLEFVPNESDFEDLELTNKIIWIGNPNNPDSKYIKPDYIKDLIKLNPSTIFIIDEAYINLSVLGESITSFVRNFSNLIVIKSFTKLYAIPGIRLGFIAASTNIIKQLKELHMPWAVNVLAQEAGNYILDHLDLNSASIDELLNHSSELQSKINQLTNFSVISSRCNYFLVKLAKGKASELKEYLIDKHGLLIRDASNFRGLTDKYFRVATNGNEKDLLLLNALEQWQKQD
ncbi:pyridoxal phosphate-dependent aminotransferase [Plebeiibacterium marinum]|uniref:Aminotransferase n=1 Tax=Plebeiibacterium marinum TaxID=2992111 RepID=A0AAE3SKV1_9BACT|nr:aminotransferase class I/II-fold pyridoxal phosphate-dependent enzyme [Plebeiobacterium marinum]MCW3807022.1 histidinol-phosphate aminotransferase family protein [Plebeiobacterium marinum]